jgi:hypothetical protein
LASLILRYFSLLFHFALTVFLAGTSGLAWASGATLDLRMLPWEGTTLIYVVFLSSLAGLTGTLLAAKRIFPWLFVVWSAVALVMVVWGYFFSSYKLPLDASLWLPSGLVLGVILAAAGCVPVVMTAKRAAHEAVLV